MNSKQNQYFPQPELEIFDENEECSYYAIAPSSLILDNRISSSAKITYLCMSSMIKKRGYCFPSNEHLSQQLNIDVSTVKRYLDELEEFGYIIREIGNHGLKKWRRIWKPSEYERYKKTQSISKNVCEGSNLSRPEGSNLSPPSLYSKKEVILKEKQQQHIDSACVGEAAALPLPPSSKYPFEDMVIFALLPEDEKKEVYEWFLERRKTKKIDDDKAYIADCIRNGYHKEKKIKVESNPSPQEVTVEEQERRKSICELINRNYLNGLTPDQIRDERIYIDVHPNHVTIGKTQIAYKNVNFKEVLEETLKKHKIPYK